MGELDITDWIVQISDEIREIDALIAPLKHLGKHEWAAQLSEEVKLLHKVRAAIQRIGESKGKQMGRPPQWLQTANKDVKELKRKPPENG